MQVFVFWKQNPIVCSLLLLWIIKCATGVYQLQHTLFWKSFNHFCLYWKNMIEFICLFVTLPNSLPKLFGVSTQRVYYLGPHSGPVAPQWLNCSSSYPRKTESNNVESPLLLLYRETCSCLSRGVLTQGVVNHVFLKFSIEINKCTHKSIIDRAI